MNLFFLIRFYFSLPDFIELFSFWFKMIWLRKILRNLLFFVEHNLSLHYLQIILTISFLLLYFSPIFPLLLQVVRMYRTLLGEAGFKKGMVLYFERHDGGAVTCDDFRAAMAGKLSSYSMLLPPFWHLSYSLSQNSYIPFKLILK